MLHMNDEDDVKNVEKTLKVALVDSASSSIRDKSIIMVTQLTLST